ncbi:class I SAM-dependent methyltransferase [Nocardioides daejeonensis]|uniref:class I SAM-dependent methyltransferase n=1 Tax=Nocardioides daejeonensis TaxID=1046556 RepID=UPI000D7410F2|nr:methyltransferase domain-containing protein [Nocardioides daejeonensis]
MSARDRAFAQRPLKLNLGSGPHGPQSWVNLDRSPTMLLSRVPRAARALRRIGLINDHHLVAWEPHIVRQDLTARLPVEDGAVDAIYSSHFLEHIYISEADQILRECHRVLRPGGVLRLALPDGEAWARELVEAGNDPSGEAGRRYHARLGAHPDDRPTGKRALTFKIGGHIHRWQPTRGLVRAMLVEAGFSADAVTDHGYHEGALPDLAEIETREESFFIEARR